MSRRNSEHSTRKSISNLSRTASKVDVNKDVIFKMSKKIAQLTKVIYYLNTKNEDEGIENRNIVANYEMELSDTIKDGASMIHELQIKLMDAEQKLELQQGIMRVCLFGIYQLNLLAKC